MKTASSSRALTFARSLALGAGVLGLGVSLMFAACDAGGGSVLDDEGGGGNANGSGGGSGGVDFSGSGGGTGQGVGCTSDLQAIVDENGVVVAQCPPDQGCFEGMCVPACEAAAGSKGSIGCEYWTPDPPFLQNEAASSTFHGTCYAVFIANTWGRAAQLTVRYGGAELDVSSFARIPSGVGASTQYNPVPAGGVPPGEVAVLFLSHSPGANHPLGGPLTCPVTPAVQIDAAVHNSGRGEAFEVSSDTPITAYDILPYGGATSFLPSASLLFPRTAWGDNYVVMAPHPLQSGQLWMSIVGSVDGTTVTVAPPVSLPGGTNVAPAPAGMVTSYTVNAGEIVQWLGADPTGTVVQSDQPIGMYTGSTYLRVTSSTSPSGGGQDSAHQQLAPVAALGHEYVGGSVVTRLSSLAPESTVYRIMGVVDGTQLTWDPMPPGAPTTLNQGQVAQFESSVLFTVSSQDEQHPFAMSHYMGGAIGLDRNGCSPTPPYAGATCGLGDEEWVVMVPPQQFLQRYAFFTDPTYATTTLVVTRVKGPNGYSDVNIECLGTITDWQPVGLNDQYEVAHVDLIRATVGITSECATSQHEATSDGAFGVTVWGTDYYASYGYPAGGNVGSINDVVVIPVPQ